ncbi:MAG: hypothetical protein ACLTMP_04745 [Eggerthella lenta]
MHVDTDDLATLLKMQHLDLEAMRDKKKLEELPQRAVILEARSKKAIEQKRPSSTRSMRKPTRSFRVSTTRIARFPRSSVRCRARSTRCVATTAAWRRARRSSTASRSAATRWKPT